MKISWGKKENGGCRRTRNRWPTPPSCVSLTKGPSRCVLSAVNHSSFILLQMLECGVWDPNVWHIPRESDIRAPEPQPWVPLRSQAEKDELAALADTLHLSERILEETAIDKLDHFNQLTKAQAQIERLVDIETERVESSKWNHDAAVQLISLTQSGKRIPFGTRLDLFDLNPTASQRSSKGKERAGRKSSKGKERIVEENVPKRSIYNLLPWEAKESWMEEPGT